MATRIRRTAAAVLALLAAGCSTSSKLSGGTSSTAAAASTDRFANLKRIEPPNPCANDPGVSDSGIKIGVVVPQTGPEAASFSDAITGIRARLAAANRTREIGSRQVTVVVQDDAADEAKNLRQAHELVEGEQIWALVELSGASGASAAYLSDLGIPVTGWDVDIPAWSNHANMFTFRLPTTADPAHAYNDRDAAGMKRAGVTKVALIGNSTESSADLLSATKHAFASVGIQVVYQNANAFAGSTDVPAEAQAIKDSQADGLVSAAGSSPNPLLLAQLAKDGVSMKAMQFGGGYDPGVVATPGMQGASFSLEFKPFEGNPAAYSVFNAALPRGARRNQMSYTGWLSAEMMIQGIKDAGTSCPTRKAFINNLRLEHAYTGGGAFDPVDLAAGFGQEFACAYYVKIINRQFVPQFGAQQQCGRPIRY